MRRKGITVIELLVTIGIFSMLITLGLSGFKSFQNRLEIQTGLRKVTVTLNTARYQAIKKNNYLKLFLENNRLALKEKKDNQWQPIREIEFSRNLKIEMNANPVFCPTGLVSPLCSIFINNKKYFYKITISIAGRIKIYKII